ncbi:MAG: SRPBCC family protein [Thermoleophilaceae bacterium]
MGKRHAERQIVVGRGPQECFAALVDFESYPSWQRAVKACEVHSRDSDGRGRRVSFEIGARARSLSYTLDYRYESPHLVTWDFVAGDVEDLDGEFVLEDRGDGTTLATHALRIEPGPSMPGRLAAAIGDEVIERAVQELKARVERA